jgi:hypothetical protein
MKIHMSYLQLLIYHSTEPGTTFKILVWFWGKTPDINVIKNKTAGEQLYVL